MRHWVLTASLAVFVAGVSGSAEAHLVNTRLGDFYGGALHPLTGFEYLLPWLALVILAAFQDIRLGRWLFLIFPLGLLAGGELARLAPELTFVAVVNIALIAALGVLVALAAVLPPPVFVALCATIAIVQGYENGRAIELGADWVLFVGGLMAVGYAFVALVSGLTIAFLAQGISWRRIALRAGGSWIAAIGIMVFGFEIMRAGGAS